MNFDFTTSVGHTVSGVPRLPAAPPAPIRKVYARLAGKLAQWDVPARSFKDAIHAVQRDIHESTGGNAMALVVAVDNTQTNC